MMIIPHCQNMDGHETTVGRKRDSIIFVDMIPYYSMFKVLGSILSLVAQK